MSPPTLFGTWLVPKVPAPSKSVPVFHEEAGTRALGLDILRKTLIEHYVGEATVAKAGGYEKAAGIIENSLPTAKRVRSGDLGEVVAAEYVNAHTEFRVPIRKLRWKDDRDMAMRGNDFVGISTAGSKLRLLKGEAKSAQAMNASTVKAATEGLDDHDGRPNPSTLAFITKRLYEEDRDEEANVLRDLQAGGSLRSAAVTHLVFTLSGNDAAALLETAPKSAHAGIRRSCAAVTIPDHSALVEGAYELAHVAKP